MTVAHRPVMRGACGPSQSSSVGGPPGSSIAVGLWSRDAWAASPRPERSRISWSLASCRARWLIRAQAAFR